jgi:hypothetical protein
MAQSQRKSIRKLVTLSAELAERVEKFQREISASSESDALKILIEDGLKMRDRPYDLFRRCESAVKSGQGIGDIVERLTADHPLVENTTVNGEGLFVYLKTEPDARDERFYLSRSRRTWSWQRRRGDYGDDQWEAIEPQDPDAPAPDPSPHYGGRGRSTRNELDDEIPF